MYYGDFPYLRYLRYTSHIGWLKQPHNQYQLSHPSSFRSRTCKDLELNLFWYQTPSQKMSIVRLARPYFRFRPSMSQLLAKLCQTYSSGPAARLPRVFPSTGFEKIDPTQSVEEERLPAYRRGDYYPVHIGQVIHENYQVVAKLGYGTTSTVWLSRDLRSELYLSAFLSNHSLIASTLGMESSGR